MYETVKLVNQELYSPTLAMLRVVEPLFESLPQAFLQLPALLLVWDETPSSPDTLFTRLLSISFSVLSLAYATTDLCSADALLARTEPAAYPEGRTQTNTSCIQELKNVRLGGCSSVRSNLSGWCTRRVTGAVLGTMREWLGGICIFFGSLFKTFPPQATRLLSRITPGFLKRFHTFVSSFFPAG